MTRTTRTWYAFACVAVLASATQRTANAQQIRPYRPAFDVADYTIALDLPDTGATIHANALLTVARTGKSDTLVLDLLDLTVNGVTVDGRAAKFVRNRETVDISLPHKSGARPTYKVSVDYGGAVTDGLIARSDSAGRWTYFGDNWPNRARHWIPSIDHPSDKATVTWRVTTDANRTVVANGRLVSTRAVTSRSGATGDSLARDASDSRLSHGRRRGTARRVRLGRHRVWSRRAAAVRAADGVHGAGAAHACCPVRSRGRARSCNSSHVSSHHFRTRSSRISSRPRDSAEWKTPARSSTRTKDFADRR